MAVVGCVYWQMEKLVGMISSYDLQKGLLSSSHDEHRRIGFQLERAHQILWASFADTAGEVLVDIF